MATDPPGSKSSYELGAIRIENKIRIDGDLSEPAWQTASMASGFTENEPEPNTPSSQRTEVRILYDDEAIYVGAKMYDTAPDSILSQLTERDELGNTDFFGLWFSCFEDGINAFEFFITPSGVQLDAQVSVFNEDFNWNAVWQCNTSINEDGWTAEFKIPYSALRFPDKEVQSWDVNFTRVIRRVREQSFWHPVDPTIEGFINQSGKLTGIENISPPVRLFFTPYASAYYEVISTPDGVNHTTSYNGGMDLKYGINDAFTLDMTLVPDFGQVVTDNKVLNLSPFEVQFRENRAFFTEGTELFNKGDLFYSRRIGGIPPGLTNVFEELEEDETIIEFPGESQLINATKISGRNSKGLGLGFFNAVSLPSYAKVENTEGETREIETAPLTNYNILVFDQNLKHNSYVTLINTNVTRNGGYYDANVIGTEFRVRNEANTFQVSGDGAYSKKFNYTGINDQGFRTNLALDKIGGNWNYGYAASIMDAGFDPNDLGFLTRNNQFSQNFYLNYNMYQPKGKFNRIWSTLYTNLNRLYEPNVFTSTNLGFELNGFTRKFNAGGLWIFAEPWGNKDYFEPRRPGKRYYEMPIGMQAGGWISTDYRKKFAYDIRADYGRITEDGRYEYYINLSPRYRVSDRLMLIYEYAFRNMFNDVGWVADTEDDDIILGRRYRNTQSQLLTVNYVFTNRMSLGFRLRHYWSTADYNAFFELQEDGSLLLSEDYQGFNEDLSSIHDGSYNAFNIDMVYRWVFAPGSEINIVWKNIIDEFDQRIPDDYYSNLERTLNLPQSNSFSIRVLYFIDYHDLRSGGKFIEN